MDKPTNKNNTPSINNALKIASVGALIVAVFFIVWEIIFLAQSTRLGHFGQDLGYALFSILTFFWRGGLFLATLFVFYKIAALKQKNRYYYFTVIALILFLITLIIPMIFWVSCIGCARPPNYNDPYYGY